MKIESISPINKSGLNPNPQAYTEKKWKRKTGSLRGNGGTGTEIGSKKRDVNIDIDSADCGTMKRTNKVLDDSSIPTAEAAEQPRRTL